MPDEYVNNIPADVRPWHGAIVAAMRADGRLPKDLEGLFKLTRCPAGSAYAWRLDLATPDAQFHVAGRRWNRRVEQLRKQVNDTTIPGRTTLVFEGTPYTIRAAEDLLARLEAGMSG